jgi:hypothetical protein
MENSARRRYPRAVLLLRVRPALQFAVVAALVLAAESALLASAALPARPLALRAAVLADLCLALPAAYWLLVVRANAAGPRTTLRVALAGLAVGALLFGAEVRLLAVPLELALVWVAVRAARAALRSRAAPDAASALQIGLSAALGDGPLVRAAASELSILWYALFSWGRTAPPGFTAHRRAGWTAIYAALGLCMLGESVPLHFVLPRTWAWASAALHGYSLLWMLGDLRAMQLRRIQLDGPVLRLRLGLKWEADLPLAQLTSAALGRAAEALPLAVLGTPNLVLRFDRPVTVHGLFGIAKTAQALALQVDEPEALLEALRSSPWVRRLVP